MTEQNWNQASSAENENNQQNSYGQYQQPQGDPYGQPNYTQQNPQYNQQYSQYPQQPYYQQPYPTYPQPGKGKAVGSLVLGICAIVFCWLPIIPVILAIIGFVLYSSAKKQGFAGGLLTGALIVNIIGIIFSAIYTIIWIVFIGIASYASSYYTYF